MSIIKPASLLAQRSAFLLRKAISDTTLSTIAQIIATGEVLKQLIDSIGTTLLRQRIMQKDDLPYRDDYKNMIEESQNDAENSHHVLQQLVAQSTLISNISDGGRSTLLQKINTLEQQVSSAENTLGSTGITRTVGIGDAMLPVASRGETITELFADSSTLDIGNSSGISFFPDEHLLTLNPYEETNLATQTFPYVELIKDRKVVGWPGNTLEVENIRPSGVSGNSAPSADFVGDSDKHNDLTVMFDDNPDTWFEIERCDLPTGTMTTTGKKVSSYNILGQRKKTSTTKSKTFDTWMQPVRNIGFAYIYDEGGVVSDIKKLISPDTWKAALAVNNGTSITEVTESKIGAPEDGVLKLSMGFPFSTPQAINKVEIDPYIFPRSNGLPVFVERIDITTEDQQTISIITDSTPITSKVIYTLPKIVSAKYIRIILSQSEPYTTLIGHPFYAAKVEEKKKKRFLGIVIGRSEKQYVQRAENPDDRTFYNSSSSKSLLGDFSVALAFGGHVLKNNTAIAAGAILSTFGTVTTKTILDQETGIDIFTASRWAIGVRSIGLKQSKYAVSGYIVSNDYTFSKDITAIRISPIETKPSGTEIGYEVSTDGEVWYTILPDKIVGLPFSTSTIKVRISLSRRNDSDNDVLLTPSLNGFNLQGFFE